MVLIAVARLELTPSIPILARIDVKAANIADKRANRNHIHASNKKDTTLHGYI